MPKTRELNSISNDGCVLDGEAKKERLYQSRDCIKGHAGEDGAVGL